MRSRSLIQRHPGAVGGSLRSMGLWLLAGILFLPVGIQAQTSAPAPARELASAFRNAARQALPAVVFITVDTTSTTRRGSPFHPFGGFGDDFLERFFGRRTPEGQEPPRERHQGAGSGFLISPDGMILTNHHVVGEADRVTVRLSDGREFTAKTLGTDPASDVAVIKIEARDLPILTLGDSDAVEVGDWAIAAGSPLGLTQTVTVGVISAKGRSRLGIADFEDFMQTDAAINPGNSGGPLLNLQGEAIGVNTAIASRSGGFIGIGFAIPSNMAKAIQQQLVTRGKVVRGYIGVSLQPLSGALAQSLRVNTTEGVLVAEVAPGSPAAKAGLKRGDVIASFNAQPVHDPGQLRNLVAMTAPGTQVKMQLLRGHQTRDVTVELGELPRERTAARGGEERPGPARLGFSVQNLTPEIARQLGIEHPEGVVVTQIDPQSMAYQAGVRRGMVIREVNQHEVKDVEDFRKAAEQAEQDTQVLLLVQGPQATIYLTFPLA